MFLKKSFKGGVHPHDEKKRTHHKAIEVLPPPEEVVIPVQQHIGAPATPLVAKGDVVKKGQPIAEAKGFVSIPCHASISGEVVAVEPRPHPLGMDVLSVVIKSDGQDAWLHPLSDKPDNLNINSEEIKKRILEAGIAGLGGATFPSHVKLSPPQDKTIDTIILNGAECEPYLTADHRLMLEQTEGIVEGLKIIMHSLGVSKGIIALESNKNDAVKMLRGLTANVAGIQVMRLPVKYPQGAEKQLIKATTGRNVPAGGLPMDVGCLVHNVGTALAIYEAVAYRKPLIERIVTVTGPGVVEPKNVRARIGTSFSDVIDQCGGYTEDACKVINGGPMMGISQLTDDVPVIKGTSGILVLPKKRAQLKPENACIGCARCVDTCPMKLVPTHIATFVKYDHLEKAEQTGLFHCMECGTCAYICPSKINLVHYIKLGKTIINEQKQKARTA